MEAYESFADSLSRNALLRGNAPAVVTELGENVSYAQLAALVQKFACRLHASGVKRGQRVAVHGLNRFQFLISVLAIARLGAGAIVWNDIRRDAELLAPDHLVTTPAVEWPGAIHFPVRFENLTRDEIAFVPAGYGSKTETALIVGTSGSTGHRKYVTVTAAYITQLIEDQLAMLPRPFRSAFIVVPPTVLFGMQVTLAVLHQGARVVWQREKLKFLAESQITNIIAAPGSFRDLLSYLEGARLKPNVLEYCITGGSVVSQRLGDEIKETFGCDLLIQYGSTELGPAAFGDSRFLARNPGFAGRLAPWISAWTVNDDGDRLPAGASGRLVFKLHGQRFVAPYLRPAAVPPPDTACQIYVSEDHGSISEQNILTIESRDTERINLGGNKTNIHAVKDILAEATRTSLRFEVLNAKTSDGYDGLVVFVVGDQGAVTAFAGKVREAALRFDISRYVAVNRIPTNEFGKVDYAKLREAALKILATPA